jgi:hypothetical protein
MSFQKFLANVLALSHVNPQTLVPLALGQQPVLVHTTRPRLHTPAHSRGNPPLFGQFVRQIPWCVEHDPAANDKWLEIARTINPNVKMITARIMAAPL